jgi:hypothetical protein
MYRDMMSDPAKRSDLERRGRNRGGFTPGKTERLDDMAERRAQGYLRGGRCKIADTPQLDYGHRGVSRYQSRLVTEDTPQFRPEDTEAFGSRSRIHRGNVPDYHQGATKRSANIPQAPLPPVSYGRR